MANWVMNSLQFNSTEDFEKALRLLGIESERDFSFGLFIPQPKSEDECPLEFRMKENSGIAVEDEHPWLDWYKWNTANWGVKWDCSEVSFRERGLTFWTPNGIAVPVFRAMADIWKDLEFEIDFCEEQMCPSGYAAHLADSGLSVVYYEPDSDEAYMMYNELWDDIFVKGDDGEWHNAEEEDGYY